MTGVSPAGGARWLAASLQATGHGGVVEDVLTSVSGEVAGLLWVGFILAVCLIARWWYGSDDSSTVAFDPPDGSPAERYAAAMSFGEQHEDRAEQLSERGLHDRAVDCYEEIERAYESAVEIADAHGLDAATARERLADATAARLDAQERRRFWSFWGGGNRATWHPNGRYAALIERGTEAQSWADTLFDGGRYADAHEEYVAARKRYTEAIERARDRHLEPEEAVSRLQDVEDRLERCRSRIDGTRGGGSDI